MNEATRNAVRSVTIMAHSVNVGVADAILNRMNPACNCTDCDAVRSFLRKPEVDQYNNRPVPPITIVQAAILMQHCQACGCDRCLEYAGYVCYFVGHAIAGADLPASILHELEQGQATTRDAIESQRAKLWFMRALNSMVNDAQLLQQYTAALAQLQINGNLEPIKFDSKFRVDVTNMAADWLKRMQK